MEPNTHKAIQISRFPSQYKCEIDERHEFLHICYPMYIGINLESIKAIIENETVFRIDTETTIVTLWKEVTHTHVTILG